MCFATQIRRIEKRAAWSNDYCMTCAECFEISSRMFSCARQVPPGANGLQALSEHKCSGVRSGGALSRGVREQMVDGPEVPGVAKREGRLASKRRRPR
jgi:hypothetical protein